MKIILSTFLVFALMFQTHLLFSDDLSLEIHYLDGEKSKDSHSMSESYRINDKSVSYSVKYTGHRSSKQNDTAKECTFTDQDIKNITYAIEKQGLMVNDSLFTEESKSKSFETYCNISIKIVMNNNEYNIKINGDTKSFNKNDLYKNSVYFITLIRKMVNDC